MLSMNNEPSRFADRDIWATHPSGIGRVLIARQGEPLPADYEAPSEPQTKTENKKVSRAPFNKRKTPAESKDAE